MRRLIVAVVALAILAGGGYGLWQFRSQVQHAANASRGAGGPPGGFAVPVQAEPVAVEHLLVEDVADELHG